MRLSNLADYAVVIMSAAARAGDGARLSATVLAEETGIPLPTTQKLLGKLAGAGLFRSARGGGGGFVLTRSPQAISLADVVEAVEGPIAMTSCVDEGRHDCALEGACQVRPHWGPVNEAIRGALSQVTLQSLTAPAPVRAEPVEALPSSFLNSEKKGRPSTSSGQTEFGIQAGVNS
ncbi:putative Rrf2 family transcriptional regulator [Sphingomonas changbaiensis NBRC 104936]|uniref:Putative Rrf2 family transcriptional regulator n=1 Tax=Sphingomonas changbaiensis NBRC 104936 TaxID=1219043 RepID=A0A0E9MRD8_9SPHN|nr:SUF system Fe-S cluster assembly regulator [Sphingomonas changbaiensis]GAO40347.1 putative Rrf2 family transcriptional regulator [Sphingomonas changbaiensis NBRC 104936]